MGNPRVHRELPEIVESTNLSRDNVRMKFSLYIYIYIYMFSNYYYCYYTNNMFLMLEVVRVQRRLRAGARAHSGEREGSV